MPSATLDVLAALAVERPAVVLDDDPTGTQTLRDVPVLTAWDEAAIARHLHEPVIFLSTNSRALDEAAAVELCRAAVADARAAARSNGCALSLVSRSDSTLRGHFPAETQAIAEAAGLRDARVLLAPFFGEGGRLTRDDVHYVMRDGRRVPAGATEFARDRAFGYRSSNLREWVAEKHAGAGRPMPPLASLDLRLVRDGGADAVEDRLLRTPPGTVVIANAETNADIETVALGALQAELRGLPLVARVAASYVRARAGRPPTAPLEPAELVRLLTDGGGVVLVGSHVDTTTRQLAVLRRELDDRLDFHELAVAQLLSQPQAAIAAARSVVTAALSAGRSAVVLTERHRAALDLDQGRQVSRALAGILDGLRRRPGWVLAKGGITSSDVAVVGLAMREGRVCGQLVPGVPVWVGQAGSRWPGMPLAVFPGNVGDDGALAAAVGRLLSAAPAMGT